jgi:hypothetical protein
LWKDIKEIKRLLPYSIRCIIDQMKVDFGEVLIVCMMNEILFSLIILGNQKYLPLMGKISLIYERNIMR